MKIKQLLFGLSLVIFLTSCSNDDENKSTDLEPTSSGIIILNQGGYLAGNAGLSYLSNDFGTLQNDIFSTSNQSALLGDTGQDVGLNEQYAYVVLNGSNKIKVINRYTFKLVTTISSNLNNPRYVAFSNGKMYVTNWGSALSTSDDYVAVYNIADNAFVANIPVAEGPERILVNAGKIYVAHKGGYGYGNTISVLNPATNTLVTTIVVGDLPDTMRVVGNDLFVICSGKPSYTQAETAGKLTKINLLTNTVTSTLLFPTTSHPANLDLYNNSFYYTVASEIYSTSPTATTLPTAPIFTTTPQGAYGIYSFEVENNKIFIGDAGNYSANGKVYVYSLTGSLSTTKTVGVIPAGFYFN